MITAKKGIFGLVLVVGIVIIGYVYVVGIGPLKQDAEGLESPPETNVTYDMSGSGQIDSEEQKE